MYATAQGAAPYNHKKSEEKKTAAWGLILRKRELKNRCRYFIKSLLVIY
jgi:hypothetical protein